MNNLKSLTLRQLVTQAEISASSMRDYERDGATFSKRYDSLEDGLKAVYAEVDRRDKAIKALLEYRKNNTLNFQLEKLDDYLRELLP